jgi:hypothetical protein
MTIQPSRALVRGLTVAAAAAALVLPGAAFAQSVHHRDPAKDVQKSAGGLTNAPANKTADIVHLTLAHGRKAVTAEMKLRQYSNKPWTYVSQIKTPTSKYLVGGNHTSSGTQFILEKDATHKAVTCDGLSFQVKTGSDTLVVSVPNSCLKDPKWVQVGVGYVVPGKSGASYADDGLRRRGVQEQNLTLSKKLHR